MSQRRISGHNVTTHRSRFTKILVNIFILNSDPPPDLLRERAEKEGPITIVTVRTMVSESTKLCPTNNLPSGDCLVLGTRTPIEGEAKCGGTQKSHPGAKPRAFARFSGFQNVFGLVGER